MTQERKDLEGKLEELHKKVSKISRHKVYALIASSGTYCIMITAAIIGIHIGIGNINDNADARKFNRLGNKYYKTGQLETAKEYYDKAIKLDPDKEVYQSNLMKTNTLMAKKDKDVIVRLHYRNWAKTDKQRLTISAQVKNNETYLKMMQFEFHCKNQQPRGYTLPTTDKIKSRLMRQNFQRCPTHDGKYILRACDTKNNCAELEFTEGYLTKRDDK